MHDRKKRLLLAVLAMVLPGPWTPVIVLAYILGRISEQDQRASHRDESPPCPPPDPYAWFPVPHSRNLYPPTR